MRNPERIHHILKLIEEIWRLQPDTRFLQLVENLKSTYEQESNGGIRKTVYEKEEFKDRSITSYRETSYLDGFYVEDDSFVKFLETYLENLKG